MKQKNRTYWIFSFWKKYKASRVILIFLLIALMHPFIANERPLYCKIEGKHYFPVVRSVLVNIGIAGNYKNFENYNWKSKTYDALIMPLIPYSANSIDSRNQGFKGPIDDQTVDNMWQRHWMGTDLLGRDVLAGVLKGTEIAVKIGFTSVFFALIIALVLGLTSAYSVRFPFRWDVPTFILMLVGSVSMIYFLWLSIHTSLLYFWIPLFVWLLIGLAYRLIKRQGKLGINNTITFPFDALLLRLLEAMKAIPTMIFILACITLIQTISVEGLIIILAFIMWPGLTRYIRAEALKVLNMDYVTAAKAYGASGFRILWRHVAPKLFSSLSVILAFSIASAIMIEATLSFLGIGIPVEQVSWGSLLKEAKINFSAWWLAIFPGLALFLLIYNLNLLGEEMMERKK